MPGPLPSLGPRSTKSFQPTTRLSPKRYSGRMVVGYRKSRSSDGLTAIHLSRGTESKAEFPLRSSPSKPMSRVGRCTPWNSPSDRTGLFSALVH